MRIPSNISSYSYSNQYQIASQKAAQQVATGKKVNQAADNPAVLAILSKMAGQISGYSQGVANSQSSADLLNTAEGSMGNSSDVMQRMRQLSVQAANGTLTDEDRSMIQQEMGQLSAQVDMNAGQTQYNTIYTNNGMSERVAQTGANAGQNQTYSLSDASTAALGIQSVDVSTQSGANDAIAALDKGLSQLSSSRAYAGTMINSLHRSADNSAQMAANQQSSASSMGDSDVANAYSLFQQSNLKMYVNMMMLPKQWQQQQNAFSILA
ncbi:MAG: hypothetical protein E6713_09035 [Sporomusaceae bacterium]|nr:hypothetical protein [Sporomusaceae bacterium]